ncbi:urease accessory protein UreD [Bradyrhizobium liaoningense]|uniref:urease accessory protein UreD n=1 Tax=Bradyrhizobium liaoningense TaxID=43992 RepID=UPI001BAD7EBA|nr:urease accessory protein UreD [Bradyrhizobium liaoningense]MBR0858280.1 urease accessory protein UreD [Bradyrhizobium liaoningense]
MLEAAHQFDPGEGLTVPAAPGGHGGAVRDVDLERARGAGRIVLTGIAGDTRVAEVYQRFPIALMLPEIADASSKEVVIVNASGGIAGGDRLDIEIVAREEAAVVVTNQAAEKVYRALDQPARIITRLKVCETARLAWLPQETIVFNGARSLRQMDIEIHSGAELIALEWLILGRTACGEDILGGHIADGWRIKKDGRLIWADGFRLTDDVFGQLHRAALLSDYKAVGTLVYFGPGLDARLGSLRDIAPSLECQCAATIVGAIIIVRVAATDGARLRRGLRSLLEQFGEELGAGPFGVPRMWSC